MTKCKDCNCDCKQKKDIYLHAIKMMYNHLGSESTKEERKLLKCIEKEILKVSGFNKKEEDEHSVHYYDKDRNKPPNFP